MSDLSDSDDDEYSSSEEGMATVNAHPPGVTGLALVEHYFGSMLSPVAATPAQWKAYTERIACLPMPSAEISLILANGPLAPLSAPSKRSSVSTLPREAEILARIYSPSVPEYIDVHINYYCRTRYYQVEWFYSIGYKIYNRVSSDYSYQEPSTDGLPSMWHTRQGWQSICWGYFDDENGNYGPKWRRVEVAEMGLHEEGVLDVYEVLFGPIETPSDEDAEAVLGSSWLRVVLASHAGTDEEQDRQPCDYTLEGLSDLWVAAGLS